MREINDRKSLTFDRAIRLSKQGVKVHRRQWGSGYLTWKGDQLYLKLPAGHPEPYALDWTDRNANDWETFEDAWW